MSNQNKTKSLINPVVKIARYYTTDNPEELKTREYIFEKRKYSSKKIFKDLISSVDLQEIHDIQTKKRAKVVFYTTNLNPDQENKEIFYIDEFPNNKLILDYLTKHLDLEFINLIENTVVYE
jgi:shikimate 5-dehydrogenase